VCQGVRLTGVHAQGPAARSQLAEYCQRNCLLTLSLVFMPMPGSPRRERCAHCTSCWPCSEAGFSGTSKQLINSYSTLTFRSLATANSQAVASSAPTPVFVLASLLRGDVVREVFAHVHTAQEARLALDTLEVLFAVSQSAEPADMDMVRVCVQSHLHASTDIALDAMSTERCMRMHLAVVLRRLPGPVLALTHALSVAGCCQLVRPIRKTGCRCCMLLKHSHGCQTEQRNWTQQSASSCLTHSG
jgi:hypothetical protein